MSRGKLVQHRAVLRTPSGGRPHDERRWADQDLPARRYQRFAALYARWAPVDHRRWRLLTIEDTVEFHNLVLQTRLTEQEKQDLVAFLRCL